VNYGPTRNHRIKFRHKFPGSTVLSKRGIHNVINKARSARLLLDKRAVRKLDVLTKIARRSKGWFRTPQKSLRRVAQETGATKLL
jgi:hypothetical protein